MSVMQMGTSQPISVGCVVMAAGNAVRFGKNKLAAVLDGRTLLRRALDTVPTEQLQAVAAVVQDSAAEDLVRRYGFLCLRNDRPELGQSRTIRLGTEALQETCRAIVYLVADQPLLRRESVETLIGVWHENPDRIVAAARGGVRGNPCVFPAEFFPELCALTGDVGGSAVIRRHEDRLLLVELDPRELTDVDTPDDLARLKSELSRT